MMKKISVVLTGMMFIGVSATAVATKPTEAQIYHCGCQSHDDGTSSAGADLRWNLITVSPRSRGHRKHKYMDIETCTYLDESNIEQEVDLERGFDDCEVFGSVTGVSACEDPVPVEGAECEDQIQLLASIAFDQKSAQNTLNQTTGIFFSPLLMRGFFMASG